MTHNDVVESFQETRSAALARLKDAARKYAQARDEVGDERATDEEAQLVTAAKEFYRAELDLWFADYTVPQEKS